MLLFRLWPAIFVLVAFVMPAGAASITLDFESFLDGDNLSTQLPGLTFTNTVIYSAGASLNELELPPRSGSNVASDLGGAITVTFDTPVAAIWAYFTYLVPVTLDAYDSGNKLLGSVSASFLTNLAQSGDPGSTANERLQVAFAAGIARLVVTGDPGGGSFVMDDLAFGDLESSAVPEPSTQFLFGGGLVLIGAVMTWRRR